MRWWYLILPAAYCLLTFRVDRRMIKSVSSYLGAELDIGGGPSDQEVMDYLEEKGMVRAMQELKEILQNGDSSDDEEEASMMDYLSKAVGDFTQAIVGTTEVVDEDTEEMVEPEPVAKEIPSTRDEDEGEAEEAIEQPEPVTKETTSAKSSVPAATQATTAATNAVPIQSTVSSSATEDSDAFKVDNSIQYKFYKPTGPEQWLYIHSANEGISNWRLSLAQLLYAAKGLDATIVEPCIANGMLRSCNASDPGLKLDSSLPQYLYPLREIFDMNQILDFHPKIVPYHDFVQITNYQPENSHKICLTRMGKAYNHICKVKNITNHMMGGFIPAFNDSLAELKLGQHGIVELYDYWRNGLIGLQYPSSCNKVGKKNKVKCSKQIFDNEQAKVLSKQLHFPNKTFETVHSLLDKILPNKTPATNGKNELNFGAIQFRPETKALDYVECAKAIVQSRNIMAEENNIPKENFVLLSPLSTRKSLVWAGVQATVNSHTAHNAVQEALDLLAKEGLLRLETVHSLEDGTLPAVWDMSMAAMATSYATCAKGKQCKRDFCQKCNYRGKSAGFTLELRRGRQNRLELPRHNSTYWCWPEEGKTAKTEWTMIHEGAEKEAAEE